MKNSCLALYTVPAIRRIEEAAMASLPKGTLMQRAGEAAAAVALSLLPSNAAGSRVLVLAGPGNNGGDAFVLASCLSQNGAAVTVLFDADPDKLPEDARSAYARATEQSIDINRFSALDQIVEGEWDLVIDGLFGIGLSKALAAPYRDAIEAVNRIACPILALDIPSGLHADTGAVVGEDGVAVRATHTITFISDKPGLHTGHGRDLAGVVHVADLDIDPQLYDVPDTLKNDPSLFSNSLSRRPHNSHKGSYGSVAIIGGSTGMHGAAILAGRSALHLGAGRVYVGFLNDAPTYDAMQPELMCKKADQLELNDAVIVAGPGLGTSPRAREQLLRSFSSPAPLVLDADALNLLSADAELRAGFALRSGPCILTPHPLEAARLLGTTAADIQADRPQAARELASRLKAVVVLKGSGTVIACPEGKIVINGTGNPALATAGTGDVLAGMCGALLAQARPVWEVALAAVWIHGMAADRLVQRGCGPVGLTAGELIPAARDVMNRLINRKPDS